MRKRHNDRSNPPVGRQRAFPLERRERLTHLIAIHDLPQAAQFGRRQFVPLLAQQERTLGRVSTRWHPRLQNIHGAFSRDGGRWIDQDFAQDRTGAAIIGIYSLVACGRLSNMAP